jgi:hypothetical protein
MRKSPQLEKRGGTGPGKRKLEIYKALPRQEWTYKITLHPFPCVEVEDLHIEIIQPSHAQEATRFWTPLCASLLSLFRYQ